MHVSDKILIVEGKTDKHRIEEVLVEPVQIICTHGTMGISKLDEILEESNGSDVYILTDSDKEGRKIRQWFKRHISEGTHVYIDSNYGEVSRCPLDYLAMLLAHHGFYVDERLLMKGKFENEEILRKNRYNQSYSS